MSLPKITEDRNPHKKKKKILLNFFIFVTLSKFRNCHQRISGFDGIFNFLVKSKEGLGPHQNVSGIDKMETLKEKRRRRTRDLSYKHSLILD